MQHLSEEQLVLYHYRDAEAPAGAAEHLMSCNDCRVQYDALRRVLTLVDEMPVPNRDEQYGSATWNRLRWKLGAEPRRRRLQWLAPIAAAAVLALVFFAGQLWQRRNNTVAPMTASKGSPKLEQEVAQTTTPAQAAASGDRVLLLVVSDHLDSSERVLLELANADPTKPLDISTEQKRAGELVASNRLYRQTASQRGDTRIVSILSDLEPVLVELSHSGSKLSASELVELQKRIESKGLLFKVRVVSAQTSGGELPAAPNGTNSL